MINIICYKCIKTRCKYLHFQPATFGFYHMELVSFTEVTLTPASRSGWNLIKAHCDCLAATGAYFGPRLKTVSDREKGFQGNMSGAFGNLATAQWLTTRPVQVRACIYLADRSTHGQTFSLCSHNSKPRPISVIQTLSKSFLGWTLFVIVTWAGGNAFAAS